MLHIKLIILKIIMEIVDFIEKNHMNDFNQL